MFLQFGNKRGGLASGCLLLLLSLILFVLAGPATWAKKDKSGDPGTKHPKLTLTATPAFGFAPLQVDLSATLTGVGQHDPNFCHPGVSWVRVDPGPDSGTRITEDPSCVHGEDEIHVTTTFHKSFYLGQPGTYHYRLIVRGNDGEEIRSNFMKVRVLRVP